MSRARIALIGALLWLLGFAALYLNASAFPSAAQGLYRQETGPPPFQWTSNRVAVPIHGRSGPTRVALTLRSVPEQGQAPVPVTLTTNTGLTATLPVSLAIRSYSLWLPPETTSLTLQSPVRRLQPEDERWLGVQLLGLTVTPSGLPLREAALALLAPLAGLPMLWALRWLIGRGYGAIVGLTAIGLAMRLIGLFSAPPGIARDELVSQVDAWFLLRTGHDHLGHLLPIAAFEAYGDWISPLLTYLELPIALFGIHPFVARIFTAIIGALAVPAVYGLARALGLPRVAAAGAALTAACMPWIVFLSRTAKPPALVPLAWALCLWSALLFLRSGRRRDAFWLAGVAGLALYTYPTMKMTVPLLVGLAVAFALYNHGWARLRAWRVPALLLALTWLPFALSTLFNTSSSSRFDQVGIHAPTTADWLLQVWGNYRQYFSPAFYYLTGDADPSHGLPDRGVAPLATAPVALIGVLVLAYDCVRGFAPRQGDETARRGAAQQAWLIVGAAAIAALPASLTLPNPHTFRAAALAPVYAIVVGYGAAAIGRALALVPAPALRRALQVLLSASFAVLLIWEGGAWLRDLMRDYAPNVASGRFSDGLIEAVDRALGYAPTYDDVWFDTASISKPYIYVLAARPLPPQEAQRTLVVERAPAQVNNVRQIGRFHFDILRRAPKDLPVLEAITDQFGNPAYVIQEWEHDGERSLLVRGMGLRGDD